MVTVGHPRLGRRVDDRGETLVELIVALAILGIGAVAVLAAFQFSVLGSDVGRKQATSDAYVRSVAEAVQNAVAAGGYQACSGANYVTAAVKAAAALPAGYGATQSSSATNWNGSAWSGCNSALDYAQRIEITVTSPDTVAVHKAAEKLTMIVRKPCNATTPSPYPYSSASPC